MEAVLLVGVRRLGQLLVRDVADVLQGWEVLVLQGGDVAARPDPFGGIGFLDDLVEDLERVLADPLEHRLEELLEELELGVVAAARPALVVHRGDDLERVDPPLLAVGCVDRDAAEVLGEAPVFGFGVEDEDLRPGGGEVGQ